MGTYVCIWLIHFDVQQKLTQYCEAIILQERSIKKQKTKKTLKEPRKGFCTKAQELGLLSGS